MSEMVDKKDLHLVEQDSLRWRHPQEPQKPQDQTISFS